MTVYVSDAAALCHPIYIVIRVVRYLKTTIDIFLNHESKPNHGAELYTDVRMGTTILHSTHVLWQAEERMDT